MIIFIFYILLLIIQIINYVKWLKTNDKMQFIIHLTTTLSSIFMVLLFLFYVDRYKSIVGWNIIEYLVISSVFITIFTFLLASTIIILIVKSYKKVKFKKSFDSKKVISFTAILFISFITAFFLEITPYYIKVRNDIIDSNSARTKVISYLNKKYGEGFSIESSISKNICDECSFLSPGIEGYEFTIRSEFLDDDFTITIKKDNHEIYKNYFLDKYFKIKYNADDYKEYLKEYKVKKINEEIHVNFNAEISFEDASFDENSIKDYGQVPSIEELSSYITLVNPKFDINDNLTTKEELLDYLKKLTFKYIQILNTQKISYKYGDKYFRYKYDYSKLGVNNYTDEYNGYGGYVLAGNIIYSEEKHRYVTVSENKIVKINILGNVTTLNVNDLNK